MHFCKFFETICLSFQTYRFKLDTPRLCRIIIVNRRAIMNCEKCVEKPSSVSSSQGTNPVPVLSSPLNRHDLAEKISACMKELSLDRMFGAEVMLSSDRKYYSVLGGVPRTQDIVVKVYSNKFIIIAGRGNRLNESIKKDSIEDAIAFLKEIFEEEKKG